MSVKDKQFSMKAGVHDYFEINPYAAEDWKPLQRFVDLVRDDEREQITSEWWSVVQGDLENGVKSLNEQAALKWRKEYPSMASFGEWLEAKGNLNG